MRRLLILPLLLGLSSPVQAEIDPEVHELCLKAADYQGCVAAQSGKIPELRVIEGKTEVTGNRCPYQYVYIGGGMCRNLVCNKVMKQDPALTHLNHLGICPKTFFGTNGPALGDLTTKATYDPKCPNREPWIHENASCKRDKMYY